MESNYKSLHSVQPAILASSPSSTWINEDLMVEILKRLPVKILCRFRSVSKSWKSLIPSRSFITHQYFSSSTTPANLKSYIRGFFRSRFGNEYHVCRPQDEHFIHNLHFPFRLRYVGVACSDSWHLREFGFVDLIHGVICLCYLLNRPYSDSFVLWNPAIHKYMILPLQPFPSTDKLDLDIKCKNHYYDNGIGFGYNNSRNDFKVVRIWIPNYPCICECKSLLPFFDVYSVREGLWRMVIAEDIKKCRILNEKGCFLNGTIHWMGRRRSDRYFLLMFDCEREEFTTMDLSLGFDKEYPLVEIFVYGGTLSMLVDLDWDGHIELWVMEEYGVASSWRKAYELSKDIDIYGCHYQKLAPYGPKDWIISHHSSTFENILCYNVYEESMFLIDETTAKSYENQEIAHIDVSDPYRK